MFEPLDPKALEPGKMRSNNDVVGASGSDAAFVTVALYQIRVTVYRQNWVDGGGETEAFRLQKELVENQL